MPEYNWIIFITGITKFKMFKLLFMIFPHQIKKTAGKSVKAVNFKRRDKINTISRFKESEENVKSDIFHCYDSLLLQTKPKVTLGADTIDEEGVKKPLTKVAASSPNIDLRIILGGAIPMLGSFLRKNQRAFKVKIVSRDYCSSTLNKPKEYDVASFLEMAEFYLTKQPVDIVQNAEKVWLAFVLSVKLIFFQKKIELWGHDAVVVAAKFIVYDQFERGKISFIESGNYRDAINLAINFHRFHYGVFVDFEDFLKAKDKIEDLCHFLECIKDVTFGVDEKTPEYAKFLDFLKTNGMEIMKVDPTESTVYQKKFAVENIILKRRRKSKKHKSVEGSM